PKYDGKPVIPTKRSMEELEEEGLDIDNVVEILEKGFDCSRSKRRISIEEKCVQKKSTIIKVVVEYVGDYWKLIHVGSFKRRFK
ncbi:MAG: hypothetical protein ACE5J5_04920, partial [Candidatus Hydrothermarchaeales archaeon]